MGEFDEFIDAAFTTPPSKHGSVNSFMPASMSSPDVSTDNYVVIDEKAFKPGLLFSAINKGCRTLSMNHGKGLNILRKNDWVIIQILEAGCGKRVQHQSAPYDTKKARDTKTTTVKVNGQQGIHQAWD